MSSAPLLRDNLRLRSVPEGVNEVIGPSPQIAPKKRWVGWMRRTHHARPAMGTEPAARSTQPPLSEVQSRSLRESR
jgi:hypothetical protein